MRTRVPLAHERGLRGQSPRTPWGSACGVRSWPPRSSLRSSVAQGVTRASSCAARAQRRARHSPQGATRTSQREKLRRLHHTDFPVAHGGAAQAQHGRQHAKARGQGCSRICGTRRASKSLARRLLAPAHLGGGRLAHRGGRDGCCAVLRALEFIPPGAACALKSRAMRRPSRPPCRHACTPLLRRCVPASRRRFGQTGGNPAAPGRLPSAPQPLPGRGSRFALCRAAGRRGRSLRSVCGCAAAQGRVSSRSTPERG
jgi:hypothetical protein